MKQISETKATSVEMMRRFIAKVLLVAVMLSSALHVFALGDVVVRLYNQRNLIAGSYNAFCNDSRGFLWIGTDAGLLRFDGNNSDLYRNDELDPFSMSDNKVVSLFTDSKGRTWIGTFNGLNLYDEQSDSFRLVRLPGLLLNGYIRDISEFPDGRVLFLVSGVGLYTVDMNSIDSGKDELQAKRLNYTFDDDKGISRLKSSEKNEIYFSTISGEVCRLKPDNTVEKLAKIDRNVSEFAYEPDGNLVLGSQYEVFRLNPKTKVLTSLNVKGKVPIKVTDICPAGDITYFSTGGDGVWEVRKGSLDIERVKRFNSSTLDLSSMKLGSVFEDKSGNIWLGCNHKGVAMAPAGRDPFSFKSFASELREEGGAELTCMCIAGGRLVVGLNNGKVLFVDKSGNISKVTVYPGGPVTSLSPYSDDKLLVGVTRGGIWNIDLSSLALSRVVSPTAPFSGVLVSVCGNGDIVAAFGELGVVRYNPSSRSEKWFHPVLGSNLLSCLYYAGISTTSDGKVWIGGYSGLACYDPDADSLIPIGQDPFLKGVVYDVCDYDNGVMIATDRGLMQYNLKKGVVRKLSMSDGLPDNDVRTLERDDKGGIWIGTMKGIAYLPVSDSKIRSCGSKSGMSSVSNMFSGSSPSESSVMMGNFENVVFFNPDSVSKSTFGADVCITGLYVNGRKLTGESSNGSKPMIEGSLSHPDAIHLSYKENSLVLRLSTMDFRDNSDLRYEWQLAGDGDTWHSSSPGESLISLPPLKSGHHVLRLRGWEKDMSSDITELNLDVKAPWYLSNMATSVYAVLVLLIFCLIYKVVKNKREEELYEARIRYFMDISHELRSPITLMLSPVETLLKQDHSPETTSQLLTLRRNGQRVLNLVDQLLDLRKIEKGKMRLVFTPVDIKAFVAELVDMFRPMAEDKKQSISFRCSESEIWGEADRNNLDKILVNLISNAIKYTPEGGSIVVALEKSSDSFGASHYSVTVTDTGIGLDNKVISHLFERFYRDREQHHGNTSGFGIGLDLCMRLVELHKGEIKASNRDDGVKGSVFTVTLPLIAVRPGSYQADGEPKHRPLPNLMSSGSNAMKPAKSGHRFKIMMVDDDEELREYIKASLSPSYKVVTMPDAESALKELSEKQPDLIVTDIRMEGIDGLALLRRIKGNMATQHIPVILCSSEGGSDVRVKGWKSGADGYLSKPFTIDELDGMISGLLSNRNMLKGKFSGSHDSVDKIVAPKIKGVDEELMDKINRYINENLSEAAMNVDGLSDYVGLSRSQLHRRMKDIVGVAPSDYIRNVKLRKACEMLSHGDVDIAQVAYSLGFNAQSHFSTLFKRYTGMTPSEYRAMGKGE